MRWILVVLALAACEKESKPRGDGGSTPPPGWRAAVGAAGLFAQTFDDREWTVDQLGERDLYAVTCVGNVLGWAAGAGGAVWRTTDGGRTWEALASGTDADLRAVRFGHDADLVGVVAGDGGFLAVSQDGVAWTRVPTPPATGALRGAAIAHLDGRIVVVGDAGVVLRSVDRGATFLRASIADAGELRAVASDDAAHLIVAVGDSGAWSSADGGATFHRESTVPLRSVAVAPDGSRALAVGDGDVLTRDRDSSAWTPVPLELGADVSLRAALISHDGTRDYLAGDAGTLFTRDGASFEAVPLDTTAPIFGLEDLDP